MRKILNLRYHLGSRLRAAVLLRSRGGDRLFPLIPVFSDYFKEKKKEFSGKRLGFLGRSVWVKILGYSGISWVLVISDFPVNFRAFVGFLSAGGFLVKIPGILGVLRCTGEC